MEESREILHLKLLKVSSDYEDNANEDQGKPDIYSLNDLILMGKSFFKSKVFELALGSTSEILSIHSHIRSSFSSFQLASRKKRLRDEDFLYIQIKMTTLEEEVMSEDDENEEVTPKSKNVI